MTVNNVGVLQFIVWVGYSNFVVGMVENNEGLKGYLCHMFGIIVEINRVL